jgi:hypothetical protein
MTLREWLEKPSHRFRWGGQGGDDCTTFCASWVDEVTGVDPAEDLRGTYRDAEGAHAILNAAGGIVAFIAARLGPLGYVSVDHLSDGDVGVIRAPVGLDGDTKEIGAIRFGPLWATLGPAGVRAVKADFVAAWSLAV